MLKNLRINRRKNHPGIPLEDLRHRIEKIRLKSPILAICPGTTGYNWMGVNRATFALFPDNTLELSQYYSETVYTASELHQLVELIAAQNFDRIVFSGFPRYFENMISHLNKHDQNIFVIYHGFFSQLSGNDLIKEQLIRLIDLTKSGVIQKVAFNKKGMAESIAELWGINTVKIILKTPIPTITIEKKYDNCKKIGILGNENFRKNLHNQVVGASMIDNAEIHVTCESKFDYLPKYGKIIHHPTGQNHSDFLKLIGSMDVNLHLSFSESWGQITTESLALGIPCLIANHSDIYDYNPELKSLLVVEDYDNSWEIKKQISKVLESSDSVSEECKNYVSELNTMSDTSIQSFLND